MISSLGGCNLGLQGLRSGVVIVVLMTKTIFAYQNYIKS